MTFIRNLDGIKDRLVKLPNGYKVKLFSKDGEVRIYVRGKTKDLGYLLMESEDVGLGKIWKVKDISMAGKVEMLLWDVALEWVNRLGDLGIEVEKRIVDEEYYYLGYDDMMLYMRRGEVYYSDRERLHCYKMDGLIMERLKHFNILEVELNY